MFNNQLFALLGQIVDMPQMTFYELAMVIGKTKEETEKEMHELNEAIEKAGFPIMTLEKEGYSVPEKLLKKKEELTHFFRKVQVYLDEEERRYILYLYTFIRQTSVSNFHFQELLHVSKNTALTDVKKLRVDLEKFNLEFKYSRLGGYYIAGEEGDKRKAALHCINLLLQEPIGEWALSYIFSSWDLQIDLERLTRIIKELALIYGVSFVDSRLSEMSCLIEFIRVRQHFSPCGYKREEEMKQIEESNVYLMCLEAVEKFLSADRINSEALYLSTLLLGLVEGNIHTRIDERLVKVTHQVIQRMEALALVVFDGRDKLIETLYTHLVPVYYRIIFDMQERNTIAEQIKRENEELFVIVENALQPLSDLTRTHISDDEVAYFVIHFGGQIQKQLNRKEQHKAMIVCPSGVSSSLILKSELEQLFPEFYWLQEHSKDDFDGVSEIDYDLVFSTVFIHTDKPLYIVKPVMNHQTKSNLIHRVSKDFLLERNAAVDVDELLKIIRQYADVKNEKKLVEALSKKTLHVYDEERKDLPMLEELLTEEYIQIYDNQENELSWKESIQLSCKPLIENGIIEERYIQAIFDKLAEFGAFIDLGQGVAIPHARPDEGVLELGISLLKLSKPVSLLGDEAHKIDLFITLAAIDNETHLKALSQLTQILSDSEKLERLKSASAKAEIFEILKNKEEDVKYA